MGRRKSPNQKQSLNTFYDNMGRRVTGIPQKDRGRDWESPWGDSGWILPKFGKRHKPTDSRHKGTTNTVFKLLKAKGKERKNYESSRKKATVDLSSEATKTTRNGYGFQSYKIKTINVDAYIQWWSFLGLKRKSWRSQEKDKLRDKFVTSQQTLKEWLIGGALRRKEKPRTKGKRNNTVSQTTRQ